MSARLAFGGACGSPACKPCKSGWIVCWNWCGIPQEGDVWCWRCGWNQAAHPSPEVPQ